MATCRSCSARIRWATSINGRLVPLDATPDPAGNIIERFMLSSVRAVVLPADELSRLDPVVPRFTSHFATCPNSAQHRKKRVGGF